MTRWERGDNGGERGKRSRSLEERFRGERQTARVYRKGAQESEGREEGGK